MNIDFRSLSVGDPVPPAMPDTAIFVQGAPRWHALRVAPQREDQAEAWLWRRGVYAFHPVEDKVSIVKGLRRTYQRRYLPGYVMAHFPGDPLIARVLACPFIAGAIQRADGEWGILLHGDLRRLHAMRKIDRARERANEVRALRRKIRLALKPGDNVRLRVGPLSDLPCEIAEMISAAGAVVRYRMFGREYLAHVRTADLRLGVNAA